MDGSGGRGSPEMTRAVAGLWLALASLFGLLTAPMILYGIRPVWMAALFGVLGFIGWYVGSSEVQAIDAGRHSRSRRRTASAAKVLGLAATILWWLFGMLIVFSSL